MLMLSVLLLSWWLMCCIGFDVCGDGSCFVVCWLVLISVVSECGGVDVMGVCLMMVV